MGTIADKLNRVLESKSQIKDALISKGVEIPDGTPFRSYSSLVDNIQTGSDLNLAFGENPPEDTSKLWVKSEENSHINISQICPTPSVCYTEVLQHMYGLASASVDRNIYIFGSTDMYKYNTVTSLITKLDSAFPSSAEFRSAASVGDKVYIFGGMETKSNGAGVFMDYIYVYDTSAETLDLLNISLPHSGDECYPFSVGTKIYIVRGSSIHILETDGMSITTCDITLPHVIENAPVSMANDSIYIFGYTYNSNQQGSSNILKYDIPNNSLTTIGSFKGAYGDDVACSVGSNIYIYGNENCIYKFNCLTNELVELEMRTPWYSMARYVSATAIDDYIYYIGGMDSGMSKYLNYTIAILDTRTEHCVPDNHPSIIPPYGLKCRSRMGAAVVGHRMYMFGGCGKSYMNGASYIYDFVSVYDTESDDGTYVNVRLPDYIHSTAAAAIGTKIYLFGGITNDGRVNTIIVFDTENEEFTELDAKFHTGLDSIGAAVIGTKVYLFGGNSDDGCVDSIYVFDSADMSLRLLDIKLPLKIYATSASVVDDRIYLFGGCTSVGYSDSIYTFDVDTEQFTLVNSVLPQAAGYIASTTVGGYVYLIGGLSTNGASDRIIRYNTKTQQVHTLIVKNPNTCFGASAATIDDTIYVAGGESSDGVYMSSMYSFDGDKLSSGDGLVLLVRNPSHPVTLLNTGDITLQTAVNSVYKGNSDGTCTKIPAHVYENGEWVEI